VETTTTVKDIPAQTEALDDTSRPSGEILAVNGLGIAFKYPRSSVQVVSEVSFSLTRDETLVLVGESGSGKSVTARSLIGLLPDTASVSGSILFEGKELVGQKERQWGQIRATGISMVFQDPMRSLNPTMRIGIQISEVLERHFHLTRKAALTRAAELLDLVGIPRPNERLRDFPHQLSGGMRQRVMIAIAIACNPKILIADEPTTALDVTIQDKIMVLLRNLQAELHMGILLITHDMGLAFSYGDSIAVMYGGRIVESAPGKVLHSEVKMPYTRGLLDSVPRLTDEPHSEFHALPGRPPDPSSLGAGCAFAPRCAYVQERCQLECPPTEGEGAHRWACWYPL
jgi:oligopeptide/dipeptide ABC transporter ATP-binding protein